MKNKILKLSTCLGISKIGFCSAAQYKQSAFLFDVSKQKKVEDVLPSCQTIIVAALSNPFIKKQDPWTKNIARVAMGIDYHRLLRKRLEILARRMQVFQKHEYRVAVDFDSVNEKILGVCAGLGVIGKNNCLIHPALGSFFVIGSIFTDLLISPDEKIVDDLCKHCDRCIKACPTKAIQNHGKFIKHACLSYCTQSKDDDFHRLSFIKQTIYGCDICQEACPYNATLSKIHPRYYQNLNLYDLFFMTNKQFKQNYFWSGFAWIGQKRLQRNAFISLITMKTEENGDFLEVMKKKDPKIYEHFMSRLGKMS